MRGASHDICVSSGVAIIRDVLYAAGYVRDASHDICVSSGVAIIRDALYAVSYVRGASHDMHISSGVAIITDALYAVSYVRGASHDMHISSGVAIITDAFVMRRKARGVHELLCRWRTRQGVRMSIGRHRLPRVAAVATSTPPCSVDVNVDVRGAGTALYRCTFITNAERVCMHCMAKTTVRVYRRALAVCGDHPTSASGTRPHHLRTLPHLAEAPRSAVLQCV